MTGSARSDDASAVSQPPESVMEGHGFYNQHSRPQHAAGDYALPLLARAVAAVPLPGPGDVVIVADYGSSQGRNSIVPMRAIIDALRQRTSQPTPVAVVHTDLPANDFASLFELLETSPQSYRHGVPEVYSYAVGESFYKTLFPADQVWIGHSSITVHWLSAAPAVIPNQIWSTRATGSVRAAFAERARADWQTFLECRANELRPGGQLVIVGSSADDQGNSGAEGLLDLANGVLQEMVHTGELVAGEYARMVIPTYYRTRQEFTQPFSGGAMNAGLASVELLECTPVVLPDIFWAAYEQDHDIQSFASAYAGFFEAAFGPSLFGGLDSGRGAGDGETLSQRFTKRLHDRIAASPSQAVCHWQLLLLRIAKRATAARPA